MSSHSIASHLNDAAASFLSTSNGIGRSSAFDGRIRAIQRCLTKVGTAICSVQYCAMGGLRDIALAF